MMCKDCQPGAGERRFRSVSRTRTGTRAATVRAWIAAAGIAASSASATYAADETSASREPASIRLWPTAVVTSERVRLEDIAQISTDGRAVNSTLRLCVVSGPIPEGGSTVLTLADVQEAVRVAGIPPTAVLFRGAARCEVSRPRPMISESAKAPTTRPARKATIEAKPPAAPPAETLEALLRQQLAARLADLGGTVSVRFTPAARRALALGPPQYHFRVHDRSDDGLGLVSLAVDVLEDGRVVDTVAIVAEVELIKPVVVARQAVNRGEVIQAKHLMLAERRFTRMRDIGISDMAALVGQEAGKFIERGDMITPHDVRARALIVRNDLVTVTVRRETAVVSMVAKAMENGTYGQTINVRSEATGEPFPVVVTGPRTAEVRSVGPGVEALARGR